MKARELSIGTKFKISTWNGVGEYTYVMGTPYVGHPDYFRCVEWDHVKNWINPDGRSSLRGSTDVVIV